MKVMQETYFFSLLLIWNLKLISGEVITEFVYLCCFCFITFNLKIWQIDHEFIQTTALKVILDLLLTFGFEALQISTSKTSVGEEEEEEEVEECEDGENQDEEQKTGTPLNSILAILTKQLDSEVREIKNSWSMVVVVSIFWYCMVVS